MCELADFCPCSRFGAKFVLGNLSDKKSYDEKLQDTWSIALSVLGVLCKSQLCITDSIQ